MAACNACVMTLSVSRISRTLLSPLTNLPVSHVTLNWQMGCAGSAEGEGYGEEVKVTGAGPVRMPSTPITMVTAKLQQRGVEDHSGLAQSVVS